MKIYARITQESNDISENEVKLLIRYAYYPDMLKNLKDEVKRILEKMYPNIDDSYGDSYIPGPWLDAVAEKLDMKLNGYGCSDINL